MNEAATLQPMLDRLQKRSLLVGVAGLAVCLLGGFFSPHQFFRSYLLGFVFWAGIALGCFALVMLHHMVGGGWGFVIRRLLESGTRTFPILALLFVPLLVGVFLDSRVVGGGADHPGAYLYEWAHADVVARDEALRHKSAYLNVPFFVLRAAFYFAIWIGIAFWLNRWSLEQDRGSTPGLTRRLQLLSGPGLLLYGLTVTFASVDWVMSLEPHWFSTIYGMLFIIGQGLATMAFVIPVVLLLSDREPLSDVVQPGHFHDLGNLLLAFVMLWAYAAFSQYLIIWSGNLPEEAVWYVHRTAGGWQWLALFLIVFHFAVPFLLLLSRRTKRSAHVLAGVALTVIFMRLVDLFWLIVPAFESRGIHVHWLDAMAPVGIGGVWVAAYIWQLKGRPLLPMGDPRFREALAHARGH